MTYTNIDEVVEDLRRSLRPYGAGFLGKGDRLEGAASILANKAVDLVLKEYNRAAYAMGDDDPDVYVDYETSNTGATVFAEGEDVGFLEFGIGKDVSAGEGTFADEFGLPVKPGSWSAEHDGPFSKYGHWHYSKALRSSKADSSGKHRLIRVTRDYTGVPGSHGMYKAYKMIEEDAIKTLNRVMREL